MNKKLIHKLFTETDVVRLNSEIHTAEDAIRWASDNLYPFVGKASSFGARDDQSISLTDIHVMTKYEAMKHAYCFTGCKRGKIHCIHGQTILPIWSDTEGWTLDY